VFLGSHHAERVALAVQQVKDYAGSKENVEILVVDVSNDDSVKSAVVALTKQRVRLSAIVNNDGTRLGHGMTGQGIMNANLTGPKRVVDAILPLLLSYVGAARARIVNIGSGSGPFIYVAKQSQERQKRLCNPKISWDDIDEQYDVRIISEDPAAKEDSRKEYGLSKALFLCYTMLLAARGEEHASSSSSSSKYFGLFQIFWSLLATWILH
jgi:NAD(P)-dependent dehydrogenase (short-subunit alcohol dehydrogenase family)